MDLRVGLLSSVSNDLDLVCLLERALDSSFSESEDIEGDDDDDAGERVGREAVLCRFDSPLDV
jgi:hypothetical protein